MSAPLLLRAASGPEAGIGHAMRTRAVAQALLARGAGVRVVVDEGETARALCALGVETLCVADDARWAERAYAGVWLDGFRDWSAELESLCAPAVLVENRSSARERASFVLQPSLHWSPDAWERAHEDRVRGGARWIPLAREVLAAEPARAPDVDLLVTFGGSDPLRLAERSLAALARIGFAGRVRVAVGPHMRARAHELEARARALVDAEVASGAGGIVPLLARARVALTALGTTLYELAWLGVPALVLANWRADAPALAHYERAGPHLPLGVADELADGELDRRLARGLALLERRPRARCLELAGGAARAAALLLGDAA